MYILIVSQGNINPRCSLYLSVITLQCNKILKTYLVPTLMRLFHFIFCFLSHFALNIS